MLRWEWGMTRLGSLGEIDMGKEKPLMRASVGIRRRARELRKEQTNAEKLLWARLRGRQVAGLKFRQKTMCKHPCINIMANTLFPKAFTKACLPSPACGRGTEGASV